MIGLLNRLRGPSDPAGEEIYLVYIDKSGTPGLAKGSHYMLLGLAIPVGANDTVAKLGDSLLGDLRKRGYRLNEIKGSEVFKFYKNNRSEYMSLIKRVVDSLVGLGSFAVAVILDKKEFKEKVLSDFRNRLDECLAKLNLAYLNVFIVPTIRRKLINSFIEKDDDLIVRAQSVNELLVRIQKALERRNAKAFIFFDSEADTLASSTYGLFAGAFRREGLAYAKGGLGRSDRIIYASLSKSSLDYGIQLADLLVNALWNCVVHKITDLYKHLDKLLGDKGLAVLPKGIKICG